MTRRQWVNLPKEQRFVGDGIPSVDHLGAVGYILRVSSSESLNTRIRVAVEHEPHPYSRTELARNPRFHVRHLRSFADAGATHYRAREGVRLPMCGGNRYRLEAMQASRVVRSEEVESWRRVYYEVYAVDGVQVPNVSLFEERFREAFVELVRVNATHHTLAAHPIVRRDRWEAELDQLLGGGPQPPQRRQYHPFGFALLFVQDISAPRPEEQSVPIGTAGECERIDGAAQETLRLTLRGRRMVWWQRDAQDDAENGGRGIWLKPSSCRLIESSGATHVVPDDHVSFEERVAHDDGGGHDVLHIRIPPHLSSVAAASGTRVDVVLYLTASIGGVSDYSRNVIVVAMNSFFSPCSEELVNHNAIHELGHLVDMVPSARSTTLDRGPHHYEGQGHVGDHCSIEAEYSPGQDPDWKGPAGCVMFGASRIYNRDDPDRMMVTPDRFCADCDAQLRQQDLSATMVRRFFHEQRR